MDSFERVRLALAGKTPDRPPVFPQIGDHAGIIEGLSYDTMYRDQQAAAEAHLKALERYGYDVVTIQVEPSWPMAEACGAVVTYPPDKCPWITKNCVQQAADIERLAVPDWSNTLSSTTMVEGTRLLAERADAPVVAFTPGPLTFSLQLMPYLAFMKMSLKNREAAHLLVSKATEIIGSYVTELKRAGASILMICEHDVQMVSPKDFKAYSLAYLQPLLQIYERNMMHVCGDVNRQIRENLAEITDLSDLHMLNVGPEVDILELKRLLGNGIGVAGNIDHLDLLPHGRPGDVERSCRAAIAEATEGGGGFMLAPGCEITADTPPENLHAFVDAARKGW